MAGARIEWEVDTKLASTALQKAVDALGGDGLALLLEDIGEYLLRSTRDRADAQVSPTGQPWAPLSPRYARRKARKRPGLGILKWDNHMIGDQLAHQVDGTTLLLGTNAPYGAIHQFGGDIDVPERTREVYFRTNKDQTEVEPLFVEKKKSNFAQTVTVPEHTIHIPARPWLGLSDKDVQEIVQLTQDHLQAALS
jgi:phage virion morphogenesis protein